MAKQWVESEKAIFKGLEACSPGKVIHIKYEELIDQPKYQLDKICQHMNVSSEPLKDYLLNIKQTSVNKWQNNLNRTELESILPIINETMRVLNYE